MRTSISTSITDIDPAGWEAWAWKHGSTGPKSPMGAPWAGWQFSAGYNRQGGRYGTQGTDLDLNIVDLDAWRRWTNQAVVVAPEPEPTPPPVIIVPPVTNPGTPPAEQEEEPTVLSMVIQPQGHPEMVAHVTIGAGHTMTGCVADLPLYLRRCNQQAAEDVTDEHYVDLQDKALRSMGWPDAAREALVAGTRQLLGL